MYTVSEALSGVCEVFNSEFKLLTARGTEVCFALTKALLFELTALLTVNDG